LWDFWSLYDSVKKDFHVLSLSADKNLVADDTHHFSSRLAYYKTSDFKSVLDETLIEDVFAASPNSWDNTSIWSGDVIRLGDQYMMFYTSRNSYAKDILTQHIGCAISKADAKLPLQEWHRIPTLISADPKWYTVKSDPSESSIHAWRDPFLFVANGKTYMLLAAKKASLPRNQRGCIAILRANNNELTEWVCLPPIYAQGDMGEVELPQIYRKSNGSLVCCFNSHARQDVTKRERKGGFYAVDFLDLLLEDEMQDLKILALTQDTGAYGFRVVPELNGAIVGFDIKSGKPVNTGISTGFQHADGRMCNTDTTINSYFTRSI
jgi:beta-fructofuranosidase